MGDWHPSRSFVNLSSPAYLFLFSISLLLPPVFGLAACEGESFSIS